MHIDPGRNGDSFVLEINSDEDLEASVGETCPVVFGTGAGRGIFVNETMKTIYSSETKSRLTQSYLRAPKRCGKYGALPYCLNALGKR
jgi:hypothetical protein